MTVSTRSESWRGLLSSSWYAPFRRCGGSVGRLVAGLIAVVFSGPVVWAETNSAPRIRVSPEIIRLEGPESSLQLLVTEFSANGQAIDRTFEARFALADPTVASIDARGRMEPLRDGQTTLQVEVSIGPTSGHATGDTEKLGVPVEIVGVNAPAPVSFRHDVIPVLTKAGCNSGGCHGKAEGQNGFRLSLFGFDAESDFQALVQQSRGRRIQPAAPELSLLVRKATAQLPHGGGQALLPDSFGYRRMVRWIAEGAERDGADDWLPVRIEVEPAEQVLKLLANATPMHSLAAAGQNAGKETTSASSPADIVRSGEARTEFSNAATDAALTPAGTRQQLRVIAVSADGRRRDVTAEAAFESNAKPIAEVDSRGLIQGAQIPGEAAILARYMGHVAVCRVRLPQPGVEFPRPPANNFVDELVWDKLQQMGVQPAELCDDATFLRRVYLDVIGTLPTAAEARKFLADPASDKRRQLIDQLLQREEYAIYWSLRWSDLLKVDANALGSPSSVAMHRWLRQQFAMNRPYDQLVRELLSARGNLQVEGPAPFYATLNQPKELASATSQLFLGVRIECAECHHHPFERWSQHDFYALAGFFTGLKQKTLPDGSKALITQPGTDLRHPRTGELVPAAGLGAATIAEPMLDASRQPASPANTSQAAVERKPKAITAASKPVDSNAVNDRRLALAAWMTEESNPFFARAMANRIWAHYFGRGLVEPIDDMRATNPATNEPLLEALAKHLRDVDYDLHAFTRTLLNSRVYQLASGDPPSAESARAAVNGAAAPSAAEFNQYFAEASYRPLAAEVLLDAICQTTGVPEKFNGWPVGARAIEVWDNRVPSYFFRIFGRPERTTVCACERGDTPSVSQALHLMNSPEIVGKIQHRTGRARRLTNSAKSPAEIVDELYLTVLSRPATESEQKLFVELFNDPELDRRSATEDVLWTLLNTKEFLFNH